MNFSAETQRLLAMPWPGAVQRGGHTLIKREGDELTGDLRAEDGERTWYIARAATRQERRAEEGLIQHDMVAYVPRLTRWHRVGSRKRLVHQPLFEGYMFVGLASGQSFYELADIEAVHGVVRFGLDFPREIPFGAIRKIADQELGGDFDRARQAKLAARAMVEGEAVRITEGQFGGFSASFVGMTGKDRVRVLVHLFGRSSPMELKASQIEAVV